MQKDQNISPVMTLNNEKLSDTILKMVAAYSKLSIRHVQLQFSLIPVLLEEVKLNRRAGIPADSPVMSIK